jgi:F-type H+-transporting ATPase subunit delta
MADERTLARRYARALLGVAEQRGEIDRVEADLQGLGEAWHASADLRTLMAHPSVPADRKRAALAAVLAGRVSDVTLRFFDLLLSKKRLGLVRDIAEEYGAAADEARGIAKAHVTTYMALGDRHREKLVERLQAFTSRAKIVLEEEVDPTILGGIIVRIGDQVLDGSVRGKLRGLRERLTLREGERAQQAAAAAAEALGG